MTTVKTTAELQAALAAGTDPQTIQIAASESVDVEAIKAGASAEAVTAERARIKGINELAVKGFEQEITAAIDAGTSVEATALQLFKASQDRGINLGGIKADAQGTKGVAAKGGGDEQNSADAWNRTMKKIGA